MPHTSHTDTHTHTHIHDVVESACVPSRLTQHLNRLNSSTVSLHGDMSSATNVLFKLSCP